MSEYDSAHPSKEPQPDKIPEPVEWTPDTPPVQGMYTPDYGDPSDHLPVPPEDGWRS